MSTLKHKVISIKDNYDGKRKQLTMIWKYFINLEKKMLLLMHYLEFKSIYYVLFQYIPFDSRLFEVTKILHLEISSRRWRVERNQPIDIQSTMIYYTIERMNSVLGDSVFQIFPIEKL